jgi:hypothetical protein
MEKKLNKKVQEYQVEFKNNIKKWLEEQKVQIIKKNTGDDNMQTTAIMQEDRTSDLLKFVFDYTAFELTKDDFQKRKRAKNTIPQNEKCVANRSNGQQCTRRRKPGHDLLCGTHLKGTPHGVYTNNNNTNCDNEAQNKNSSSVQTSSSSSSSNNKGTKVEVWVQEIKGINYYIDSVNNVYRTEDIISSKPNPDIIAKWKLNANDKYTIPEFGI